MTATTAQPCSLFCCRAASFRRRGVLSQEHTPTVYISPSNALVVRQASSSVVGGIGSTWLTPHVHLVFPNFLHLTSNHHINCRAHVS